MMVHGVRRALVHIAGIAFLVSVTSVAVKALTSEWVEGFNNKVRLIAGGANLTGRPDAIVAGVEIVMPPGWKTYWRAPGDACGIPPEFDWSQSTNLREAFVLYPVPHRLVDKAGTAIGYKDRVIFPIFVQPKDAARPIGLHLHVSYGACKDICIPAEAELSLDVPPSPQPLAELSEALERVPRTYIAPSGRSDASTIGIPARKESDPHLESWTIALTSGKPKLVLTVRDPGGADGDAFVTAAGGTYLPQPTQVSRNAGITVYEVDLADGVDVKDLDGKSLTVTLAGSRGQSEVLLELPANLSQK